MARGQPLSKSAVTCDTPIRVFNRIWISEPVPAPHRPKVQQPLEQREGGTAMMIFDTHNRGGCVPPIRRKFRDNEHKFSALATWAALGSTAGAGVQTEAPANGMPAKAAGPVASGKAPTRKNVAVSAVFLIHACESRIASAKAEIQRVKTLHVRANVGGV